MRGFDHDLTSATNHHRKPPLKSHSFTVQVLQLLLRPVSLSANAAVVAFTRWKKKKWKAGLGWVVLLIVWPPQYDAINYLPNTQPVMTKQWNVCVLMPRRRKCEVSSLCPVYFRFAAPQMWQKAKLSYLGADLRHLCHNMVHLLVLTSGRSLVTEKLVSQLQMFYIHSS